MATQPVQLDPDAPEFCVSQAVVTLAHALASAYTCISLLATAARVYAREDAYSHLCATWDALADAELAARDIARAVGIKLPPIR